MPLSSHYFHKLDLTWSTTAEKLRELKPVSTYEFLSLEQEDVGGKSRPRAYPYEHACSKEF